MRWLMPGAWPSSTCCSLASSANRVEAFSYFAVWWSSRLRNGPGRCEVFGASGRGAEVGAWAACVAAGCGFHCPLSMRLFASWWTARVMRPFMPGRWPSSAWCNSVSSDSLAMVFSYFAVRLSSRPRNGPGRFEVFRALGKAGGCAAGSGVASVCGAVVRDVEVVVLEKNLGKERGRIGSLRVGLPYALFIRWRRLISEA